jgi:hypothetical protein
LGFLALVLAQSGRCRWAPAAPSAAKSSPRKWRSNVS